MARDHANLRIDIWDDEDYTELTHDAQWLYERLMSHSTLSYCGVAEWRPGKLAASSSSLTRAIVEAMATELEAGRYILVDRDTEEVLLRSFVKHDGLMGKWNLAAAVARSWSDVASKPLKGVIVHELIRLKDKRPEYDNWDRDDVQKVMARKSIDPTEALSTLTDCPSIDPTNAPILAPSIAPRNGGAVLPSTYYPLPTTDSRSEKSDRTPASPKRKHQMPKGWKPKPTHQAKADELRLALPEQLMAFTDYHLGKGSTYLDWDRAFNTWLTNAKKFADRDGPSRAKPADTRHMPDAWR